MSAVLNGAEDGTRRVRKRVGAAFGGVITGAAVVVVAAGVDVDVAASALSLGIGGGGDGCVDGGGGGTLKSDTRASLSPIALTHPSG